MALTLRLVCGLSHRRRRPRVPGPRADDGRPHHPRQEEDRRGPHPVPGTGGRRAARAAGRRPGRRPPALHDRAHRALRRPSWSARDLVERAVQLGRTLRRAAARRARGRRAARAAAAHRRAAGHPHRRRRPAAAARRAGPHRAGTGPRSREGPALVLRGAAEPAARPVRAAGRDRRACTPRRRPGTTPTGRRSSRCTTLLRPGLAVAGGRAQPGRRASASPAARPPDWPRWTRSPPTRSWPATPTCRPPGPTSCAGSAGGRGAARPTERRWSSPATPSSGSSWPAGCAELG